MFLYRLGRACARHRKVVLAAWVVALVGLGVAAAAAGGQPHDAYTIPGTESTEAQQRLEDHFPQLSGATGQLVFHDPTGRLTAAKQKHAVEAAIDAVDKLPHVSKVVSPFTLQEITKHNISKNGRFAFTSLYYDIQPGAVRPSNYEKLVEALRPVEKAGVSFAVGGSPAMQWEAHEQRNENSELIGLVAAIVILSITFGAMLPALLPPVTAIVGVGVGYMLISVISAFTDVSTAAPILATMIGLGVGIDYALFIISRHRDQVHHGNAVEDSIGRANATSGQAVVFAGCTVAIAVMGLFVAGIPLVDSLAYSAALIVLVAVTAGVTLVPAMLGFVGSNVDRLRVPGMKPRRTDMNLETSWWANWARHVSHRPWRYLLATLAFLSVFTAPSFSMRLGQIDSGNDPKGSPTRTAYDWVRDGFGPGYNGPLMVVVNVEDWVQQQKYFAVYDAVSKDKEVSSVGPPLVSDDNTTAAIIAYPVASPQSTAVQDLVNRLRDDILPNAAGWTEADPQVTGMTAGFIDLSERMSERLPWFILAVIGLSFGLLMGVFRSIAIPVKAAAMNLLSISAAYGVVVAIFQWGWGKELVGIEGPVPIVSFIPMMMFAILFGLSMDYEVFMLSRIREEHLHGRGSLASVQIGLAGTARVITSAALIMVCVFSSYLLSPNVTVKMMSIGLTVAVAVDATLVRMILVPATMDLLGDRNWWLPRWLDRLIPNLDIEGGSGLPAPELAEAAATTAEPGDTEDGSGETAGATTGPEAGSDAGPGSDPDSEEA